MTGVNPWVVFAVASAAVFLVSVDATIAVAAFPALRLSFANTSPSDLSWVLNAYTILYAALLVPAGRLVDLHGSRRLFLIGVTVFTLASAACGLAPGTGSLIAVRVIQAVGGAILTPASLALILGAFPSEKRTAIVGMWSGVGALGAAVGPGAGGILIELASWRAAFLVNLPFGALIVWFAWRRLPMLGGAARGEGLDLFGIGLIVAGISALTYGIVQIESLGLGASVVWMSMAAGTVFLCGYVLWARGRKNAAIDMALFEDRTYALVTEPRRVSRSRYFWKDGVHGNEEDDEAIPGGAARARRPAGARAGGGAWLAVVGDPFDRREGGLQRRDAAALGSTFGA